MDGMLIWFMLICRLFMIWAITMLCCDIERIQGESFYRLGLESPLSQTTTFFLTINCPFYKDKLQRSIWRYLLYNQLHLPCCVSVAVGDPCQTVNGPFGRILAKLILASGLLLVMDLCTFNLIFDSMTNPQGTKEEEEKEKSCPNLVLASCITWPLPT